MLSGPATHRLCSSACGRPSFLGCGDQHETANVYTAIIRLKDQRAVMINGAVHTPGVCALGLSVGSGMCS